MADKEIRNLERQILSGSTDLFPDYVARQARTGLTETLYLVVGVDFEYNDEYYFEQEGSHPITAFVSQEAAKKEASRLTLKWLQELGPELGSWHPEGLEGLFDGEDGEGLLTSNGAEIINGGDGIDIAGCNETQLLAIANAMSIAIYRVIPINLYDGLCSSNDVVSFCNRVRSEKADG